MNAIEVNDVVVRYKIIGDGTPTLRRRIATARLGDSELVTALDGVSFEVKKGEAFGIVGRNGAGKSTLMTVLARTLRPDSGSVTIRGETSTLLQLGVGFNGQLTGARNVYLGSLAMGMAKKEVDEKFRNIVEFAELADAIDRPLNTFSSGMRGRLAFSIAMHMKPSIMLVDEVLSVGDQHFKKKSIAAMEQMLDEAGTIVYVSHSLGSVKRFCDRAMWLDQGRVKMIGGAKEVVKAYQASD